nr:UDP-glucuronosyltransferase 2B2-like [Leptinotarsa decemlineata]
MSNEFKKAIVGAFAEIPYKVLMKIDGELEGISSNVLVQNWMPQQDILRHPNIKLFITQGGLQSLQEAVTNDIPLIGIPFFGDQITNINKVVKWGYGIKLDKKKISKEVLLSAINEVMTNPK